MPFELRKPNIGETWVDSSGLIEVEITKIDEDDPPGTGIWVHYKNLKHNQANNKDLFSFNVRYKFKNK